MANQWCIEELSSQLKEALRLKWGVAFDKKAFHARGDVLWAQTEDPFLREALQSMWDHISEWLEWGDPAEQLPLRIDLCLLSYFGKIESTELCRCRKAVLGRTLEEQGRIVVSADLESHVTALHLDEPGDETTAAYDMGRVDGLIQDFFRTNAT